MITTAQWELPQCNPPKGIGLVMGTSFSSLAGGVYFEPPPPPPLRILLAPLFYIPPAPRSVSSGGRTRREETAKLATARVSHKARNPRLHKVTQR